MGYNHQRIKANARTFYKNNSGRSVVTVLIYYLLTMAVAGVYSGIAAANDGEVSSFVFLLYLAAVIFGVNVLMAGLLGWFRRAIYEPVQPGAMFEVFNRNYMGKVGTFALKNLYISLWSLLLWIPGIIKYYEYSLTEFIKEENPNIPADRCIKLSQTMTNGHKGDLFYLDLSFIGWHILGSLTAGILEIGYVMPYYFAARAFAYEELKAEAAAAGKIDLAEITGAYGQYQGANGFGFDAQGYGQNNGMNGGYGSQGYGQNPGMNGGYGSQGYGQAPNPNGGFGSDGIDLNKPQSSQGYNDFNHSDDSNIYYTPKE